MRFTTRGSKRKLALWIHACLIFLTPILKPCVALTGQSRLDSGELKGFTASPTEHIINRYDERVKAHVFRGIVVDDSGLAISGVIVEVRGPGKSERVIGTLTDKGGRFMFRYLRRGSYTFKVTNNGFQSVVGEVQIVPSSGAKSPVRIILRYGV